MFLVKAFRAHQRQPVSILLINADMTREWRFAELCLNRVMQYCLPYNMKILISQVKRWSLGNRAVHYDIANTGPTHANPVVIFLIIDLIYRSDFLLKTSTQLTAHWWKINILNKNFDNLLFKTMSLCVRIKVILIEYKYFGLNTNICYWI